VTNADLKQVVSVHQRFFSVCQRYPSLQPQTSFSLPISLCQEFLRPDQPIPDMDSIRALDGAFGTIAAANVADFPGQVPEARQSLVIVAAEVVIGKKSHHIGHGHAFRAFPAALVTHAAV
jgi:hypothetical protein